MINVKIKLTKNGKEKLENELNIRQNQERNRIKDAIKEARDQGDLSENADYASAREEQAANEARIAELEEMLKNVEIVEEIVVVVKYLDLNVEKTYRICGSESNPFEGKISNDSPLAKACLDHKPGDKFYMTTESSKEIRLELISISE